MLQIDVETDGKWLVQIENHTTVLDMLSEAGVRAQVPGLARDADGLQRCKKGKQRVGQTGHQCRISHAPSKSWSKTQSLIARISAESDLYALVKASAGAMGSQSVIRDFGESWSTVVCRDASEASGAIQCQGLGRRRHVDCTFVFVYGISVNPKVFKKADEVNNSQGVDEEHEHRLRAGFVLRESRCGYDTRAQYSHTDGRRQNRP